MSNKTKFNDLKKRYRCKLYAVRTSKDIRSQGELSQRTGISRSTITGVENGNILLSIYHALKVCEVLGCTLNDLYERR